MTENAETKRELDKIDNDESEFAGFDWQPDCMGSGAEMGCYVRGNV